MANLKSLLVLAGKKAVFQCKGSQDEFAVCNDGECPKPESLDCVWDDWGSWQPCTCVGLKERHREVYSHNTGEGKPCEGAKVY